MVGSKSAEESRWNLTGTLNNINPGRLMTYGWILAGIITFGLFAYNTHHYFFIPTIVLFETYLSERQFRRRFNHPELKYK